jgi:large subunit ribosomal protein L23
MSLLSLSKRILGKDESKADGKKSAKKSADKKKTADVSVLAGRIGLTPIITEKSVNQQEYSIVVFRVHPSATKHQIKMAVKEQYGVTPLDVRTAMFRPKVRRRGMTYGTTSFWKKAYVTVDNIQALTAES